MYSAAVLEPDPAMLDEAGLYVEIARPLGLTVDLPGGALTLDMRPSGDDVLALAYSWARVPRDSTRHRPGRLIDELTMVVEPADPACTDRFAVAPVGLPGELATIHPETDPYGDLRGYDRSVHTDTMNSRRLKGVFNSSGRELGVLRTTEGKSFAHAHPEPPAALGRGRRRPRRDHLAALDRSRGRQGRPGRQAGFGVDAHAWGELPGETGPPADPYVLADTTGRCSTAPASTTHSPASPVMRAIRVAVHAVG
jgi:hypothetical protein